MAQVGPNQYAWDWTADAPNQPPSDWYPWTEGNTTLLVTNEQTLEALVTTGDAWASCWAAQEELNSVSTVEIVQKFRFNSGSNSFGILGYLDNGQDWQAAALRINGSTSTSVDLSASGYAEKLGLPGLPANTWHWVRMQFTPTSMKIKFWTDGQMEPPSWELESNQTIVPAAVNFGMEAVGVTNLSVEWDYIGIGINGAEAPIPEDESGEPTSSARVGSARVGLARVGHTDTLIEAFTLTEQPLVQVETSNIEDQAGIEETIEVAVHVIVNDSITIEDSVDISIAIVSIEVSDFIVFTDSLDKVIIIQINEEVNFSDQVHEIVNYLTVNEDVLLGDQVSATARFSIIDTFNVTDEQSITSHVTSHDSINFTDSIAPPRASVSVAEFIDFEETIEINVHASVIETVTVSDNSFAETHIVISDYFQEVLPNPAIVGQAIVGLARVGYVGPIVIEVFLTETDSINLIDEIFGVALLVEIADEFVVTDFIGEVQAQVFIFDEIYSIESLTWARLLEPPLRAIVKQSNTNAVLSNSRTRAVLRHMATEHVMKRNDLHPPIETKLEFGTGVPIPLFNTSVKFIMRGTAGEKVNAPATIINPTLGIVKYDWSLGDTDTAGLYRGEFEIEYPDGSTLTVPNDEYITINILEDLG